MLQGNRGEGAAAAARKRLSSELLLGLDTESVERSKIRRLALQKSVQFLESNNRPRLEQHLETGLRLVRCISRHHSVLRPDTQQRAHWSRFRISPFAYNAAKLKRCGVDVKRTFLPNLDAPLLAPSELDTVPELSGLNYASVIGSFQREMFLSALIESASAHAAFQLPSDAGNTSFISCKFCRSERILFTFAEEQQPQCSHPHHKDVDVAWAVDKETGKHPFASRPHPSGAAGQRAGTAVCLSCLYERVIMADNIMSQTLLSWFKFEEVVMYNAGDGLADDDVYKSTPAICCCRVPNQGQVCLFGLAVLSADQNVLLAAEYMRESFQETVDMRPHEVTLSTEGYATLDPTRPDYAEQLEEMFTRMHSLATNAQIPVETTLEMKQTATLGAINQSVHLLDSRLTLESIFSLSNQIDAGQLQNPITALDFVSRHSLFMKNYYEAMRVLVRNYGDKIVLMRDRRDQDPEICESCGGYGHSANRVCFMRVDPDVKTRQGGSMMTHFAENIGRMPETQIDALVKTVDRQEWETSRLTALFAESFARMIKNQGGERSSISRDYLLHGSSHVKKQKKKQVVMPGTPLASLNRLTFESFKELVNVEAFTNQDFTNVVRDAWSNLGFDTSDFEFNNAWIAYAGAQNLDTLNAQSDKRVKAMFDFVRQYCRNYPALLQVDQLRLAGEPTAGEQTQGNDNENGELDLPDRISLDGCDNDDGL